MTCTKEGEYSANFASFIEIFKTQGGFFALAFLYDLQYTKEDIKKMMDVAQKESKIFGRDLKKYNGLFG